MHAKRLGIKWVASWILAIGVTAAFAPSVARADGGDIVVGEYGSMTGSEATFGLSTDDGIKLAVKECNAAGGINGRKIKLISYDDQGKQQETVTAVTRLVEQDHVVALLGEVASSLSLAGGQVAQRDGVPMISPSSTNAQVTEIGDMIFRVCFIDSFQGYVGAKFAFDKNLKSAALLYDRSQAYSTGLKDDFKNAYTKLGGQITAEPAYAKGDNDFSAQLSAIKQTNPSCIYIPGYYTDVVNIALQARKLGITCPLIGGDGWDSDDLKNAGHALDGCYFTNHYSHEDKAPEVQQFVERFKKENGKVPDGMAALGYDAADLLFDAMKRASSLSGDDLAAAIAATKDFPGVTGKITIDENRNARKRAVVLGIKDGVPFYVQTVQPPNE